MVQITVARPSGRGPGASICSLWFVSLGSIIICLFTN